MTDITDTQYPPRVQAWISASIVFILTAIAMADRMVIAMLIGPIKQDFGIGDFQASLLIGLSFTLFYIFFLLPIGAAADRYSRVKVLAVCLIIWSLATMACGLTWGFVSLFVARMIMGAGEAGIGPCSQGIIGASFPRKAVTKPLALQGIGIQVGPAVGVAAAGAILAAGQAGGLTGLPLIGDMAPWRIAFILIGSVGIFALLLLPFLKDPTRHQQKKAVISQTSNDTMIGFLSANSVLMSLFLLGAGCSAVPLGIVTGWVPEYLQRSLGVSPMVAGSTLGMILLFSGILGQSVFSVIVDWLAGRGMLDAPVRLALLPAAMSIPLAWFTFEAASSETFIPLLFVLVLCITPFSAMNNSVAQQVATPALRSRLPALLIFSISIIGFAIGPALVGWLSEYVVGEDKLGLAMQIITTGSLVATLLLLIAVRSRFQSFMARKTAPPDGI